MLSVNKQHTKIQNFT